MSAGVDRHVATTCEHDQQNVELGVGVFIDEVARRPREQGGVQVLACDSPHRADACKVEQLRRVVAGGGIVAR